MVIIKQPRSPAGAPVSDRLWTNGRFKPAEKRRSGAGTGAFLMVELMVAMAILAIAFIPLAYSIQADAKEFRAVYQRALAMEIVDGEMEILAAGEWRAFPEGTQAYAVPAAAAKNLPPGQFQFTRHGNHLRLEWSATDKHGPGRIVREVTAP